MNKIFLIIICILLIFSCKNKTNVSNENNLFSTSISNNINENEEIKIGAIYALTGKAAKDSKDSINGISLAVKILNEKGGILGKKIKIRYYDNQSTEAGSQIAAKKAVKDNVLMIIGCQYSNHTLAAAPVIQEASIPMITDSSSNVNVTLIGDYIFRTCSIDSYQGMMLAKFAYQKCNAKRVSILIENYNEYSKGLADMFLQTFSKYKENSVKVYYYNSGDTDFKSQLLSIKNENPNLIFIPGYLKESGFIVKQAKLLGIQAIMLGADGWDENIFTYGGEYINGSYSSTFWTSEYQTDENIKFISSFKKEYGDTLITGSTALAYDTVFLIYDAITRAGIFDRKVIRNVLAATSGFRGVTGTISFDGKRNPLKPLIIQKYSNNHTYFYSILENEEK